MPKAKGMEDLKSRISKIKQDSPEEPMQSDLPDLPEDVEEETPQTEPKSVKDLEAEFERKKKMLIEKQKNAEMKKKMDVETSTPDPSSFANSDMVKDQLINEAVEEYHNDGKFRLELINQLYQINQKIGQLNQNIASLISMLSK